MRPASSILGLLVAASTTLAAPYKGRAASSPSTYADASLPVDEKANPRGGDKTLIESLLLAPVAKTRIGLLNQPGDLKFDFNSPPDVAVATGAGGHTVAAEAESFPALIGNGAAMTLGFVNGCGFNTPHVHPRATELNLVIQGRLVGDMQLENGAPVVETLINKYQMTVFPQGAMHTEFNPDCEDAVFVAGFSSADPGVQQTAQTFFNLRPDVVKATLDVETLNGADIETFKHLLPPNVALGVESCLQKCGIKKNVKRDLT
ncbi:RmlC-like cupin [Xylariomycetidae sp. FL2044]|nr:RmlC-like cupin [Xylariomycetidae sp. FL2044]